MIRQHILDLQVEEFNNSWNDAIDFFENRFKSRYFNQIDVLLNNTDPLIKYNCGFLIITIDCILIETLEQFYLGDNETQNSSESYYNFFQRSEKLNHLFIDKKDAGKFYGIVRSGLIHQAMTKQNALINVKDKNNVVYWINNNKKELGVEINRNNFHQCVVDEYQNYIKILRLGENKEILTRFKRKLLYIVV